LRQRGLTPPALFGTREFTIAEVKTYTICHRTLCGIRDQL
jgi:hypothetical protein